MQVQISENSTMVFVDELTYLGKLTKHNQNLLISIKRKIYIANYFKIAKNTTFK